MENGDQESRFSFGTQPYGAEMTPIQDIGSQVDRGRDTEAHSRSHSQDRKELEEMV